MTELDQLRADMVVLEAVEKIAHRVLKFSICEWQNEHDKLIQKKKNAIACYEPQDSAGLADMVVICQNNTEVMQLKADLAVLVSAKKISIDALGYTPYYLQELIRIVKNEVARYEPQSSSDGWKEAERIVNFWLDLPEFEDGDEGKVASYTRFLQATNALLEARIAILEARDVCV